MRLGVSQGVDPTQPGHADTFPISARALQLSGTSLCCAVVFLRKVSWRRSGNVRKEAIVGHHSDLSSSGLVAKHLDGESDKCSGDEI